MGGGESGEGNAFRIQPQTSAPALQSVGPQWTEVAPDRFTFESTFPLEGYPQGLCAFRLPWLARPKQERSYAKRRSSVSTMAQESREEMACNDPSTD